jgi:hypothetical protein
VLVEAGGKKLLLSLSSEREREGEREGRVRRYPLTTIIQERGCINLSEREYVLYLLLASYY